MGLALIAPFFVSGLLSGVPTVHAGEDVDTRALPRPARDAVERYITASGRQLKELGKLFRSAQRSLPDKWRSECGEMVDAVKELGRLEALREAPYAKWLSQERLAWERMEELGGGIAEVHWILTDRIAQMARAKAITQAEERRVRVSLRKWAVAGAKPVTDFFERAETASKEADNALAIIEGKDLALLTPFTKAFDFLRGYVSNFRRYTGLLYKTEYWARRLYHNMHSRKLDFLEDSQDILDTHGGRLDRLASAKIDPDGAGTFADLETQIEKEAEATVRLYNRTLDEWTEINRPFLREFDEFMYAFVLEEMQRIFTTTGRGFLGAPIPRSWFDPANWGPSIDGLTDFVMKQLARRERDYLERLTDLQSTLADDLKEIVGEHGEAVRGIEADYTGAREVAENMAAAKIQPIQKKIDDLTAQLERMGPDDRRRPLVPREIRSLEGQRERVEARLEREILDLGRRRDRALADAQEAFDAKREAYEEHLRTVRDIR